MVIREDIFLAWTQPLVNMSQHKEAYALRGRARGSGRLYQNILQLEGKVFLNYGQLQGQGIEGQNKGAKDLEGPSDTTKCSWDL